VLRAVLSGASAVLARTDDQNWPRQETTTMNWTDYQWTTGDATRHAHDKSFRALPQNNHAHIILSNLGPLARLQDRCVWRVILGALRGGQGVPFPLRLIFTQSETQSKEPVGKSNPTPVEAHRRRLNNSEQRHHTCERLGDAKNRIGGLLCGARG
jgi:hypothetical protein